MAIRNPQRTQGARRPVPRGDHQLVVLKGPGVFVAGQHVMTIGFPEPLAYAKDLVLAVTVDEDGVEQIVGSVIHGSA